MSRDEVKRLADRAGLTLVRTYHRGIVPIVKESTRIPMWAIHPIESLASKVRALESWSRYVVYVYQKKTTFGDESEPLSR